MFLIGNRFHVTLQAADLNKAKFGYFTYDSRDTENYQAVFQLGTSTS